MDPAPSPCLVCETSAGARIVFRLPNCTVARCARCGFVYLNGDRNPAAERRRYAADQFERYGYLVQFDVDTIVGEQMESLRRILLLSGTSLENLDPALPVLDVGCARGHFLQRLARETGRKDLMGVDTSEAMTSWGRNSFGLDLRAGGIEETGLPPDHFILITMFDVLEHVANPRDVLARVFRSLRPGGWLVLEIPSEVTSFRALAKLGYRLTGGRLVTPLKTIYHSMHLSYFDPASLRRLVESLGASCGAIIAKESHVTRFGGNRFPLPARVGIRAVSLLDKLLGTEAKLLGAFLRPAS
ncbi:MAG TPA: class I SAM-dependent methyltransferase [Candidatus Polarisedimenticolia bacterium]|jgi:2-polyprenyl-3-methyl-5-hydroxy-6-metoxy-1,4-benzoquinol methylase|nr:class I SAM-dependent methyltransferase [Candidatus Polarisedimenticolia bacterium]